MLRYMSTQDNIHSDIHQESPGIVEICYILAQVLVRSNWDLYRSSPKVLSKLSDDRLLFYALLLCTYIKTDIPYT